ncbi:MAG TPA: prepilin-type N-terminal cleavage/methylation domain-containing protein [Actinomycetota bacterium]|nr:prepilin-type N-terminal cleavage/methylation domain-containing protein [Actinomycetota bacterium]
MTRLRREDGLTLVELIVASALGLVVAGALGLLFLGGTRTESKLTSQVDAVENMRVALDQFARDARQTSAITTATCTEFAFTSYFRTSAPRPVSYRYAGGALTRSVDGAAHSPVIRGLSSATFRNPAAAAGAPNCGMTTTMRSVRLEIASLPRGATQPVTVGATATLRNMP